MAGVWFTDLQSRPLEFLDVTSLTLDEFQQLVPPFETAFQCHMAAWRMDGKPRTARRFTVDKNCPLPTPEDRLLFILVYLKTYALQVVQGRLFGMCYHRPKCGSCPNAIKLMHKCSYSLGLATLSLPPIVFPPDLLYEG